MSVAGSLIQAGGQLLGGLFSNMSTARQNRLSRQYARQAYEREYQDSIAFWNMQNAYNTPEAQMQRYRDAGLNPNLIYGQQNTAGPISGPSMKSADFRPAEWGGAMSGISGFLTNWYDLEIKQAQRDNLLTQNTVLLEDAALKEAQRMNVQQGTKRSEFDLALDEELREISAQARAENLRKMKSETDVMLQRNEREAAMNASNLMEALERVANMRGQRLNLYKDAELKQMDIDLRRMGINPNHPMWSQVVGRILHAYGSEMKSFGDSWRSRLSDWFRR